MYRLLAALLLTTVSLMAEVTILEQSPGMIRVKLTADTIRTEIVDDSAKLSSVADLFVSDRNGNEIPAFKLSLFTDHPERATLSLTIQKKAVVNTPKALRQAPTNSDKLTSLQSAIKTETYKLSPINHWLVTPVISVQNGVIEQFTEAEAVIRYQPVSRTDRPNGDYDQMLASTTLNPSGFYRVMPVRSRAIANDDLWLSPDEVALTFTVGGTAGALDEADGSVDRMVKLTPQMVSQLGVSLPISQIAVYASNNKSFSETTPSANTIPASLEKIPLILRDNNKNGLFDGTDEILFFAMGPNYWYKTGSGISSTWVHSYNDFSEKRHFYITKSQGLLASKGTFPTTPGPIATAGLQQVRVRQSTSITTKNIYPGNSSRSWIWTSLKSGNNSFTSSEFPIFNQAVSTSAKLTYHYYKHRNYATKLKANVQFFPSGNSDPFAVSSESNTVDIPAGAEKSTFSIPNIADTTSLDFQGYSINYYQNLVKNSAQQLRFYALNSTTSDTIASYRVTNIPSEFTALFKINPDSQTISLIDTVTMGVGGNGIASWNDRKGIGAQYVVASLSDALSPSLSVLSARTTVQNRTYQVRDLHGVSNQSDYMIVCPPEFIAEANTLAGHKVSTGRFSSPTVVTTEDIYREFSGGVAHPAAIRNFMTYVVNNWKNGTALSYLILLGNGHYDYKGIQFANEPNYIPPYIDTDSDNTAIEDFFAHTGTNEKPSLAVGRIPARSREELRNYIEKLSAMEGDGADNGEWRNQQVLLADDDLVGDGKPETIAHVTSSDAVGELIRANAPSVNLKKVTLFEYPLSGLEKPAAKDALINLLNKGVGAFNYFGHGAPDLIAHEKIFSLSDIASLSNYRRYMIFSAFSCSVGFFDIPGTQCVASALITAANRGAIGAVSSVRVSYAGTNESLAKTFFQNFYADSNYTLGMAYLKAKKTNNLKYYALFGDPSYRPLAQNTRFNATVHKANGTGIDTVQGAQTIVIKAKLPVGSNIDSVRVHVQNPDRTDLTRKDGIIADKEWKYSLPGSFLVNRAVAVNGDSISVAIKLPPYSAITIEGMIIRLYGWNKTQPQTVTSFRTITYDGIDPTGLDTTDKIGPGVAARIYQDTTQADGNLPGAAGNRIVIDGFPKTATDIEAKPVAIELFLSDSSSIDVSGDNPGEGIAVGVQGVRSTKSYNDDFQPIQDDPNKGRVLLYFTEKEFPQPGEYKMTVTAGDYLKNRTKAEFILDVKSRKQGVYDIGDFYAYPSPVHLGETTRFMFNTSRTWTTEDQITNKTTTLSDVKRMTLKIFTLSGQLVRQFNDVQPGVQWDLTDQKGNRLSPNVYLYRLYVERDGRADNSSFSNETKSEQIRSEIRKMVIYPPR